MSAHRNPRKKMAALQRFKLLATQCTAAAPPSPSRSPAPPCFRLHRHRRHHLRKNTKTLRRLISSPDPDPFPIATLDHDPDSDSYREEGGEEEEKKGLLRDNSRTLRDLFVSSPKGKGGGEDGGGGGATVGRGISSVGGRGGGGGGWRFVGVRNRLLRRAWRPVLVAIPE